MAATMQMTHMQMLSEGEEGGDEIHLLRATRRYEPRQQNMDDMLGEN